jgi:hypothetical protein
VSVCTAADATTESGKSQRERVLPELCVYGERLHLWSPSCLCASNIVLCRLMGCLLRISRILWLSACLCAKVT